MRFFWFFLILPLLSPPCATAFSSDQNDELRQQYDEFRKQQDVDGDHRALNDNSDVTEAYLIYGRKALAHGDIEKAVASFKSAQTLFPDDGRFSLMLGLCYLQISEYSVAEMYLLDSRGLLPASDEPLQLLVKLYYQISQLDDAERYLLELQERHPDDQQVQERLAQIRLELSIEKKMDRDVNSVFTVKFDGEFHAELAEIAIDAMQDAYAEQGALFNHYPQNRVQVILYTRDDYDLTTGSPPWSAGRYDGKIRIPIHPDGMLPAQFRTIIHHEYNHFLAQQLCLGRAPAWFFEGLAMTAESRIQQRSLDHFAKAAASGNLIPFSALENSFSSLKQDEAILAYEQSYSFVSYLQEQYGWHTLKDLLLAFSRGLSVADAFASVFKDFGLDYVLLQSEWQAAL